MCELITGEIPDRWTSSKKLGQCSNPSICLFFVLIRMQLSCLSNTKNCFFLLLFLRLPDVINAPINSHGELMTMKLYGKKNMIFPSEWSPLSLRYWMLTDDNLLFFVIFYQLSFGFRMNNFSEISCCVNQPPILLLWDHI